MNEPVRLEIRWRRGVSSSLGCTAVALALVGLYVAASSGGSPARAVVGSLALILFSGAAVVLFRRAIERRPLLILAMNGLSDPSGTFGFAHLPWEAVLAV